MNKRKIITHTIAAAVLLLPALALAHGGVDDGDGVIDADGHHAGGSELLKAWSSHWWGLLAVSSLLTSGLSYLVWKYIQVAPVKKTAASAPEAEATK